jgi:osmotically inducible protein OsmC
MGLKSLVEGNSSEILGTTYVLNTYLEGSAGDQLRQTSGETRKTKMTRTGSAIWKGGIMDGTGTVSTETGTLAGAQYSFTSRFESGTGTNPEELIGAAHAGCFSMALSAVLGGHELKADEINTTAQVTVVKEEGGFVINKVQLILTAKIPGATDDQFQAAAAEAKANCPVSKVLNAEITLEATLIS